MRQILVGPICIMAQPTKFFGGLPGAPIAPHAIAYTGLEVGRFYYRPYVLDVNVCHTGSFLAATSFLRNTYHTGMSEDHVRIIMHA